MSKKFDVSYRNYSSKRVAMLNPLRKKEGAANGTAQDPTAPGEGVAPGVMAEPLDPAASGSPNPPEEPGAKDAADPKSEVVTSAQPATAA
jgi:hypothetical protein